MKLLEYLHKNLRENQRVTTVAWEYFREKNQHNAGLITKMVCMADKFKSGNLKNIVALNQKEQVILDVLKLDDFFKHAFWAWQDATLPEGFQFTTIMEGGFLSIQADYDRREA